MASSSESIVVVSRFTFAAAAFMLSRVVSRERSEMTTESFLARLSAACIATVGRLSLSAKGRLSLSMKGRLSGNVGMVTSATDRSEGVTIGSVTVPLVSSCSGTDTVRRDDGVHAIIRMKAPRLDTTATLSFTYYSNISTHFWKRRMPSQPNFSRARMASTTVRSDPGRVLE